jgi:hypothetical protein
MDIAGQFTRSENYPVPKISFDRISGIYKTGSIEPSCKSVNPVRK